MRQTCHVQFAHGASHLGTDPQIAQKLTLLMWRQPLTCLPAGDPPAVFLTRGARLSLKYEVRRISRGEYGHRRRENVMGDEKIGSYRTIAIGNSYGPAKVTFPEICMFANRRV